MVDAPNVSLIRIPSHSIRFPGLRLQTIVIARQRSVLEDRRPTEVASGIGGEDRHRLASGS